MYHTPLYERLRAMVVWAMRHRKQVVLATFAGLVLAGLGFKLVQQQFFPMTSRPELLVDIELPEGSSIAATQRQAKQVEAWLKRQEDVDYFSTYIGVSAPRIYLSLMPVLPKESFAQILVQTNDVNARERIRIGLTKLSDAQAFPNARIRVRRLEFGPPSRYPIELRVIGPDRAQVEQIAEQVRQVTEGNPHTRNVQLASAEWVKAVSLEIDQERARAMGLTPADVKLTTQAMLSGVPVTQVRDGIESVDIVARAIEAERLNLDRVTDFVVTTRDGRQVPLSQIAKPLYTSEPAILWRRNRDRMQVVRADMVDGMQAPAVAGELWQALAPVREALPAGYRIEQGGAMEQSGKANSAIGKIMPLMLAIMLILLMIQLQSFRKTLFVFATAPLGLIGAVIALLVFQAPFGFVALLGLIALSGMIMRNTIILVDQVDQDVAAGRDLWTAVVEATVRRARPVVLTALAAVLAFVPLTLSSFWGPMAMVLMGGLTVATALTLLFLPAFYALFYRLKEPAKPASAMPQSTAPEPAIAQAAE
jgi:multidrug efflux pump